MADPKPDPNKPAAILPAKVLLVDDEQDILRLLSFALQAEGYQVITALNGLDALKLVRQERPDIMILDVMMPGMDGFEVCNELRSKPDTAGLPIIMLSALGQVADRVRGLRGGADDYVAKPVNLEELSARIAAVLSRVRRPGAVAAAAPPTAVARVLGLIGAKGGVGTTTTALNLAALLAQQKKTVILAEIRSSYGTLSAQLKWTPSETLAQLTDLPPEQIDERAINARLFATNFGVRILFGPQRVEEFHEPSADTIRALLRQLSRMADYVVLDLPPDASPAVEAAVRACDQVSIVLEPETTCIQAARMMMELLKSWGTSGSLVSVIISNRSGMTVGTNLRDIRNQLGCEVVGVVPFASEAYAASLNQGVPLAIYRPDNIAAMTLKEMASRLTATPLIGIRL
ncbi:MAG: response regulator [Anaerolineae bacterium]